MQSNYSISNYSISNYSIAIAFRHLAADPTGLLIRQWNWKTAVLSALWRSAMFAAVAARHGWRAAAGAGAAEILVQIALAGFFGALAQTLCRVRPAWHGLAAIIAIVVCIQHPLEYVVHRVRGTPNTLAGVVLSMAFSAISAAVNVRLMRRGWFLVGGSAE